LTHRLDVDPCERVEAALIEGKYVIWEFPEEPEGR
jgi:hypothetical protein